MTSPGTGCPPQWGCRHGRGRRSDCCDDPHNVQGAESDAVRKATLDWWDVTMSTRVNDPKTSAKVVAMQRCHQRDLSGHLLEQGGYEQLCLPRGVRGLKTRYIDRFYRPTAGTRRIALAGPLRAGQ